MASSVGRTARRFFLIVVVDDRYSAACGLVSLRRSLRRAQAATSSIVLRVSGRNGKIV
jgi:hypothetical protein